MSHRSHQNDYGLLSTPNTSVPGTPGSGSQDYAIEEVGEQCCCLMFLPLKYALQDRNVYYYLHQEVVFYSVLVSLLATLCKNN